MESTGSSVGFGFGEPRVVFSSADLAMSASLEQWSTLHAVDALALRSRWLSNPDHSLVDPLLKDQRFDQSTKVWTVKSEMELVRLLGALQWQNPRLKLWFRGEKNYFPEALPSRFRVSDVEAKRTNEGIQWLNFHAWRDRALRDRSPMARAAILQHYGCPTSLLDISSSYDVACAFAFEAGSTGDAHLRVYALPRHLHAVTVFDEVDVVLVDLSAELPSYCARPHVQQAAFLARCEAIYADIRGEDRVSRSLGRLDPLCIAKIRLKFDGAPRFYEPRKASRVLYPSAGSGCRTCRKKPDMSRDYLLHILKCYAKKYRTKKISGFPK
jgi:hypothetical protein